MNDNNDTVTSQQSDWKKRELGALWRRDGKSQKYLSGILKFGEFGTEQEVRVVVFTNKGKQKNEKAPDFIVYQESKKEGQSDEILDGDPVASSAPATSANDDDLPESLQ
jgi:hypothetical protein